MEGLLARAGDDNKRASYEAELRSPPFPKALLFVWDAFTRLRKRTGGGFSVTPINWPAIDAFCRNARYPMTDWEISLIEMLDDLFLAEQSTTAEGDTET